MEVKPLKKKAKRDKPNKKWTEEEIKIILNYLQDALEIEAPTAQIFYNNLIDVSGIDASWDLIRFKVRHLKDGFKKANDWQRSIDAGLLESADGASSVEAKVLQMCPHYHQLQEIFGEKRSAIDEYDIISCSGYADETVETDAKKCSVEEDIDTDSEVVCDKDSSTSNSPAHTPTRSVRALPSSVAQKAKDFAANQKKFVPKSSAAYLSAFRGDRSEMTQKKLEWKKEKFERKFLFKEKKLKADIEYRNQKLNLKKLEMQKDERMRVLQIEKEERLERYALELKWNYNGDNNHKEV